MMAQDINWKAVMRYMGSLELYESTPAARRAGERDMLVFDGAKMVHEKDLLANMVVE
jgi:hypothetical protein